MTDPRTIYRESLVWDDHGGFEVQPDDPLDALLKPWKEAGVGYLSINVPKGAGYDRPIHFLDVRRLPEIADELAAIGFDGSEIAGILGGNFRRVAEQAWR